MNIREKFVILFVVMTLVQQLVKKGILDKKKATSLEHEIRTSGKKEEEVILEKRIVPEEVLFRLKSESLKIPLKKVIPEEISLEVLETISEDSARYYRFIPLTKKDNFLEIGMVYPEDLKAKEALKFLARRGKFSYKVFLITPTAFENLLKRYKTLRREVIRALEELEVELRPERIERLLRPAEFERMAEEAPITKVVAVILRHAVEGRASDIHIEPGLEKTRVRFRLDGVLYSSLFLPKKVHPAVIARIKILSNLKIDETRVPQDGRFTTKLGKKRVDFRVSTFPTTLGEKAALRVLDPTVGLRSFGELGLEGRNLEVAKEAVKEAFGLFLASGPTGCGKTTTLYAILQLLNKEGVNIMTLEDPVEYYIEGLNQSQIRPEIGYDFSRGLRHMVRQDPDIIMVGEIRDEESASLVTHAALTGHIVLSTIHTTNALGVIPRLIDLKIAPYLIPPTLRVALAQRLVRRLCIHCKKKKRPSPQVKKLILKEIEDLPSLVKKDFQIPKPLMIWTAPGCRKCRNEGYSGQIAVYEILKMTPQLENIILTEPSEVRLREEAKHQGMITMRQDGISKVLTGITSIEEIIRVTEE